MAQPTYPAQLNAEHPLAPDVFCWLCNEGNGDTLYDLTANGNDLPVLGTGGWTLAGSSNGNINDTYLPAGVDGNGKTYYLGQAHGYTIQDANGWGMMWGVYSSYQQYPGWDYICYTYDPLSESSTWSGTTPPSSTTSAPGEGTWAANGDDAIGLVLGTGGAYCELAAPSSLKPPGPFSFSCLIKQTATPDAYAGILNIEKKPHAGPQTYKFSGNYQDTLRVEMQADSAVNVNSGVAPSTGTVRRLLATYDGEHVKMYIDGTQYGGDVDLTGDLVYDTQYFILGRNTSGAEKWYGIISDIYGWSWALDADEIESFFEDPYQFFATTASGSISESVSSSLSPSSSPSAPPGSVPAFVLSQRRGGHLWPS